MIETYCKRCKQKYFMHNRFDRDCPWCEYERRELNIVVGISIAIVAIAAGLLWLL